jgi:hypothetical protein
MKETIMDADAIQQQAVDWVVVEEEDWSGVNDCGAIFKPEEPVFLDDDRDDWPLEQCS